MRNGGARAGISAEGGTGARIEPQLPVRVWREVISVDS